MIKTLPITDVGLIAGILGLFFLLVAFYKSIFHKRRTPTDALEHDFKKTTGEDDNQPVRINDPFKGPQAQAPSAPRTANETPQETPPEAETTAHLHAFRHFTPHQKGGALIVPAQADALYKWE